MTSPHLPGHVSLPPAPRAVVPLGIDMGSVVGQQMVLLSLELWQGWADLRFARVDVGATQRLTRRVPQTDAWRVHRNGQPIEVFDAVGRGDRTFSNGEVRLVPDLAAGDTLHVEVTVVPDTEPLTAEFTLPN